MSSKTSICSLNGLGRPFPKEELLLISEDLGTFSAGSLTNHPSKAGADVEEITVFRWY